MGTKISLNYSTDEVSGTTAHLYEECFAPEDSPIFLELMGVKEASIELSANGNTLCFAIPRGLAIKLGLLPN